MIDYFGGVIFWTDALDSMVAFYRDILELPVHSVRPHFVAFELGGMRISVGTHSEVSGPARERVRVMVNLGVEDIQATSQRLCDKGVVFVRAPEQEHWGGWVATFRDPDGNLLQLLQQPPPAERPMVHELMPGASATTAGRSNQMQSVEREEFGSRG